MRPIFPRLSPAASPSRRRLLVILQGQINATEWYDGLKINAVLNWINGHDHTGGSSLTGTPAFFGMKFQSVSVAQKLNINACRRIRSARVYTRIHRVSLKPVLQE